MSLDSNGTLDVYGTGRGTQVLNNTVFNDNSSWSTTGGWFINLTLNMTQYRFASGATGNLTQNNSLFNVPIKPNRRYEITYNVSGTGVAGCLAYIPASFANKRIYLSGVSLTTGNIMYDVEFKTNANPLNFTIVAACTAGSFFLDQITLNEITSGDIIANGQFTGGGTNGIKIDSQGNVNITNGNFSINSLQGLTQSFNMTNGTASSCWMNFTGGILTWSTC